VVALIVVMGVVAAWFVVAWVKARNDWTTANDAWVRATNDLMRAEADDSVAFARIRDEVLTIGQAEVVTFNTVDYRKADESLDAWEKASTGALHDEVVARRATAKQTLENAKAFTTAKALTAAITELDGQAGTATMIVAVQLTVAQEGKPDTQKYQRIKVVLNRVADGWKLGGIGPVDVER
jgi:Mce-associated membrane protein